MPRPKGSPNKVTFEVRSKLQYLLDDLIDSLDLNELDANQRIKMLQVALQYTLPRMKQATNEVSEDLRLFREVQILNTVDEKERLDKVREYEEKHGVEIL